MAASIREVQIASGSYWTRGSYESTLYDQYPLAPVDFTVDWSDDFATWTPAAAFSGEAWTIGQTRAFSVPESGVHEYWRINCTRSGGAQAPADPLPEGADPDLIEWNSFGMMEVEFRDAGGSDLIQPALAASTGYVEASSGEIDPHLACDGNAATYWMAWLDTVDENGQPIAPNWWGFDFGPAEPPPPTSELNLVTLYPFDTSSTYAFTARSDFPDTYSQLSLSVWCCKHVHVQSPALFPPYPVVMDFSPSQIVITLSNADGPVFAGTWAVAAPVDEYQVLFSVDTEAQTYTLYVNDAVPSGSPTWGAPGLIGVLLS